MQTILFAIASWRRCNVFSGQKTFGYLENTIRQTSHKRPIDERKRSEPNNLGLVVQMKNLRILRVPTET